MKNRLLVILISGLVFSSCDKKNLTCKLNAPVNIATTAETAYLQSYLTANGLTASLKNGMFFNITDLGSGISPNLCSKLSVTYTGTLITGTTDGPQFDASGISPVSLILEDLILGWQLILPSVKTGGSVILYIPPSLGYGSQERKDASGAVVIPANSYLKFTIKLISIQ